MMTTTSRWCPPSMVVLLVVCCTSVVLAHAGSLLCDDSELCLSKRFLRFGRGLNSDPYYRLSRQFFRLNRSYQPYQDKRFLRFGRSQLQSLDDDMYDSAAPFSRKRRSLDTNDQLEVTHNHVRRSVDQSEMEKRENDETPQLIKKRSTDDDNMLLGLGDETSKFITKRSMDDKSYRNIEGEYNSESDDNNNNNGNNIIGGEGQFGKRFMRFGKRLIPVKRFMRFGRDHGGMIASNSGDDILAKRFMRFGKRKVNDVRNDGAVLVADADMHKLSSVLSLANRLKNGPEGLDGGLYGTEKRFMRFGKRDVGAEGLTTQS